MRRKHAKFVGAEVTSLSECRELIQIMNIYKSRVPMLSFSFSYIVTVKPILARRYSNPCAYLQEPANRDCVTFELCASLFGMT